MCYGCWEDAGKPMIDTPLVREAANAVAAVYEHSCAGGNLHIVLDDWNIDDSSLDFCSQCIDGAGVMPLDPLGADNPVEIDETYVGGRRRGRFVEDGKWHMKQPVFGMVERKGRVVALVTPNIKGSTLLPEVHARVLPGSII